jgi:hypothetical protein
VALIKFTKIREEIYCLFTTFIYIYIISYITIIYYLNLKSGKDVNCLNSLWCVRKQLYNKYLKQLALTELAERKLKGNLFQRPIAVIEKVIPASKLKSALRVFLECCWLFKFKSLFKYSGVALHELMYMNSQKKFLGVLPFFIYVVTIWGNTYKSNLSSLVTLHWLRYVKSFNLLKFLDIVYFNTALFLHNFYNKKLPNIFYDFFNPVCEQHSHNTRLASRSTYSLPLVRTNYGIFNIRFIGIKMWNSIDESLRHLSLPNLKKKLKLQIINSYTKIV